MIEKMYPAEIAKKIDAQLLVDGGREVSGFYAGDFLSRVMGKAPSGCGWFTVIANINVAGVCVMSDISAVILCEGVLPESGLTERLQSEGVTLITTPLSVVECIKRLV